MAEQAGRTGTLYNRNTALNPADTSYRPAETPVSDPASLLNTHYNNARKMTVASFAAETDQTTSLK
ncbi:hypothetical protein [Acetobacter oeni]|uniref:hypothetical protein n=1 Tax=Acetobacter oeni TaxID=304077 RepID=UPI0011BFD559|nr:hypothetical protein [Acetobacter oeni]MBB3882310.1 hypothetical protein [Acetobacter oeni]NHO18584.1 hypothetical protein [Acetobacter oeni]